MAPPGPLFSTTTVAGSTQDTLVGKHGRLDATALPRRRSSRVTLSSGPELFDGPNRVVAEIGGRRVSVVVPRLGCTKLRIPLACQTLDLRRPFHGRADARAERRQRRRQPGQPAARDPLRLFQYRPAR